MERMNLDRTAWFFVMTRRTRLPVTDEIRGHRPQRMHGATEHAKATRTTIGGSTTIRVSAGAAMDTSSRADADGSGVETAAKVGKDGTAAQMNLARGRGMDSGSAD